MKLITHYGLFWERTKLSQTKKGNTNKTWSWDEVFWKGKGKGEAHGIYILYRGMTPVYVGSAKARFGIFKRLQNHHHDWLAPMWDNACWYMFRKDQEKLIDVVEALLIASIPGLLNSAQPSEQLGIPCYPGNEKSYASNMLWKKAAEDSSTTDLIYKLAEKLKVKID